MVLLRLLGTQLKTTSGESKVFCLKMKGDYSRYLAEVTAGDARRKWTKSADEAYEAALDVAQEELSVSYTYILIIYSP